MFYIINYSPSLLWLKPNTGKKHNNGDEDGNRKTNLKFRPAFLVRVIRDHRRSKWLDCGGIHQGK